MEQKQRVVRADLSLSTAGASFSLTAGPVFWSWLLQRTFREVSVYEIHFLQCGNGW